MTVSSRTDLGDLCHFRNGWTPVCAITDLKSNIIASNDVSSESSNGWFVSGARLMTTRFWAASTGYLVLAANIQDEKVPDFPLDKLGIEREVCVWLGYLPTNRVVIPEDLGTHLLRCAVQVVDIVQSTSTNSGGYTVTLQLRDRMKWLMDTVMSYNPALDDKVDEKPLRSNLLLEIAQRGIGQVDTASGCSVCGKKINHNPNFYYDLGDFAKFGIEQSTPIQTSTSSADDRLSQVGRDSAAGEIHPNVRAWLDTIARFEGTSTDPQSDNGYNVNVGGSLFNSYARHPENYIRSLDSDAAGRYQFISTTFNPIAQDLGLTDFSPRSQDLAAVELIRRLGAYDDMVAHRVDSVMYKIRSTWASIPSPTQAALQSRYTPQEIRSFYGEASARYNTTPTTEAKEVKSTPTPNQKPSSSPADYGDKILGIENEEETATEGEDGPTTVIINGEEVLETSQVPPANAWYVGDGESLGPLAGSTRTETYEVPENPDFRIYTTRAPINLQQGSNFLINQQLPLDVVKALAMQEIYPTEVFQDHRDGHLYYCPRANDSSGLEDSKRFYRTYFFRNYPDSYSVLDDAPEVCPPDYNQMLMSFREEQASLDLKTNFLVSKSAPNSEGGSGDDFTIHLKTKPNILKGVKHACKFYKIYDETITSLEEAAVIAMNAARIMGKEVKAGTAVMMGDPSLTPGEVVQVIGSPLQPNLGMDSAYEDRLTYYEFEGRYNDNLKIYAEQSLKNAGVAGRGVKKGQEIVLPVYDGTTANIKVEENSQSNQDGLMCEDSSFIDSSDEAAKVDPPTMFRVEAIVHKFNIGGKGLTTEAALTQPF